LESIPGILKRLQIRAQQSQYETTRETTDWKCGEGPLVIFAYVDWQRGVGDTENSVDTSSFCCGKKEMYGYILLSAVQA
jgi:hypothetical protein